MLSQNRRKLRILYPVLHYPPVIGGLEQWEENIAKRQGEGVEVVVVTGRVEGRPKFERAHNVSILRTSFFALHDLSYSSWLYIVSAMPFVFCRSLVLLRSSKIDLLHCHGFLSALMGYFLALVSGKHFIGTEQSVGWSDGKSRWLRSFVYKKAKICVAASKAVAEEFKKLGIREEKIRVIPNGIDTDTFFSRNECKRCKTLPSAPLILSVGRLEKVKGHKYLIEAFALVKKEIPSIRLMLVGSGREQVNLEKQAGQCGIQDSIVFASEVPHDELPHYYHKADIFVMPSLSEGFGITAIEAMASGLPIVATNIGALSELVLHRQNGLLVPPGDAEALASALKLVLSDSNLKASLTEKALENVRKYSWGRMAHEVKALYKAVSSPKILALASIVPPQVGGPAYYINNLIREFNHLDVRADVFSGEAARSFKGIFFALRNFDICYAFSSSPKIFIPAFFAAKFRNKKIALRIGGDFLWERAVEAGRTTLPLRLFYEEYKKSFREKLIFIAFGFLFRRCEYIIFSSDALRNLYVNHYKLHGSGVCTIENPYPEGQKTILSFPENLVMLYAGRLVKLKNVSLLLEVLKDLRELTGENIILKIIGEGPEKSELSRLAKKLGLLEHVIFQETLPQRALLEDIKKSWLVVLPSLSDITPNLVYESCAVGMPVAVTRENFLPKSVSECLITFDQNNKNELKVALLSLTDPRRWQEYQQRILHMNTQRSFAEVAKDHITLFFKNETPS